MSYLSFLQPRRFPSSWPSSPTSSRATEARPRRRTPASGSTTSSAQTAEKPFMKLKTMPTPRCMQDFTKIYIFATVQLNHETEVFPVATHPIADGIIGRHLFICGLAISLASQSLFSLMSRPFVFFGKLSLGSSAGRAWRSWHQCWNIEWYWSS